MTHGAPGVVAPPPLVRYTVDLGGSQPHRRVMLLREMLEDNPDVTRLGVQFREQKRMRSRATRQPVSGQKETVRELTTSSSFRGAQPAAPVCPAGSSTVIFMGAHDNDSEYWSIQ